MDDRVLEMASAYLQCDTGYGKSVEGWSKEKGAHLSPSDYCECTHILYLDYCCMKWTNQIASLEVYNYS